MAVPLVVSHAAMKLIQTEMRLSAYFDPVVSLTCESRQHDNPALTDAILGGANESDIKKLALRFVKKRSVPYQMRLYPSLQERSEVPRDYIVRLSDIDFAFPPAMLHRMVGWRLDASGDNESLTLFDSTGSVILPPPAQ